MKPVSGELRRPKTSSAHALLIKVAAEAEVVVAWVVDEEAAGGDKNKYIAQI